MVRVFWAPASRSWQSSSAGVLSSRRWIHFRLPRVTLGCCVRIMWDLLLTPIAAAHAQSEGSVPFAEARGMTGLLCRTGAPYYSFCSSKVMA